MVHDAETNHTRATHMRTHTAQCAQHAHAHMQRAHAHVHVHAHVHREIHKIHATQENAFANDQAGSKRDQEARPKWICET